MAGRTRSRAFAAWLALAAAVTGADLLTKAWVLAALQKPVAILPSLNLVLVHNPGAAFGLLARAGGWQRWFFIVATVAIAGFVAEWLRRTAGTGRPWLAGGLALVLGGALGNLFDRVTRGAVVDFIDVYYGRYHWPAFNVADAAITAGAVILVLASFRAGPAGEATDRGE